MFVICGYRRGNHGHCSIRQTGSIRHTAVIPIAGDQVTNDIAVAFSTPTQHAEEIKIKYACALTQMASAGGNVLKSPVSVIVRHAGW